MLQHGVRLFRISGDVVPFGSHPVRADAWWEEFADELDNVGELIRGHDLRVSLHPGQYTVLASPDTRTVDAARADLLYHARLLDALRLSSQHKPVVHVGGAYGDKLAALPSVVRRAAQTWRSARDGVPKILYSSQAVGQRPGAHGEFVDSAGFAAFLELAPSDVEFDCMLEAMAKDLALFQLRDALRTAA